MAVFTIAIDDKATGPGSNIIGMLGGMVSALQGAGVGLDQVNVKVGGVAAKAKGMSAKFAEASSMTKGLETAASGLGAALNPVTIGIAAVTIAAAACATAITGLAFALFEGARAAIAFGEMRAGITASLGALTGQGPEVVAMLDRLGERLPFTTEKMAGWSTTLAAAGVRDLPSLQRGVQSVAASIALMRDQARPEALINMIGKLREMAEEGKGEKFDLLAKRLRGVGVDLNDVARELGTTADKMKGATVDAGKLGDAVQNALIHKGKGALAEFGAESTQIWAKFKEGISSLFEDVAPDARAFMVEVRNIALEFTKGSSSANIMKAGVTGVFRAMFGAATSALHAVHMGFLKGEEYALRFVIAVGPTVIAIGKFWAAHNGSEKLITTLKGVGILLGVVAVVAGVAFLPLVVLAGVASVAVAGVAYAIGYVVSHIGGAAKAIKGWAKSAYAAASDFISGLVNGIGAGIGRVVAAVKGLGSAAVGALKGILHIQSPSRVMAEVGLNTARGMAVGIDEGQSDVARAARNLGGAAVASSSVSTTNNRGGSVTLHAELTINNYGGGLEVLEDGLGSMLQRLATQAGIVPAVAT